MRDVTVDRNVTGIRVNNSASLFLRDSVVAGNSQNGVLLESTAGGAVAAFLDHVSVVANQGSGLVSSGSGAVARITNSTYSGNYGTGLSSLLSGQILSFGTNNNVACYLDDLYVYLKARSDGALERVRPSKREDKPQSAIDAEKACLGSG